MQIILASNSGFCFGVKRAVDIAYNNIDESLYTYGPLIHNPSVIEDLQNKGVEIINNIEHIKKNIPGKIIIRSHGVSKRILDTIESYGYEIIDATCPYVKKIHKLVYNHYKEGCKIIIVGNESHPEVIGINGWCNNNGIIINSIEDLKKYDLKNNNLCIVAQTTYNNNKYKDICRELSLLYKNPKIYNTICDSTSIRQKETYDLSKNVDLMIVIGGKNSSNTKKLVQICRENCKNVYHIETKLDLPLNELRIHDKIGITAGASTPNAIIKEVILKMNEIEKNELSFEELLNQDKSVNQISRGTTIKGEVINVNEKEVIVNINYKSDGIILKAEYSEDPAVDLKNSVNIGDAIEAVIINTNDGEGNVQLSKKRLNNQINFEKLEEAYNNKEILKGKVVKVIKGGVLVLTNEVNVFIPASLLSDVYINDLNKFIGETVEFIIIKVNKAKKSFVGNCKVLLKEKKKKLKEELFSTLEEGQKIKTVVKDITNFGAFVDLNGIDGLIHISEMSFEKIKHPSEILKIGQEIETRVISIDKEKEKISLTLKEKENDPWYNIQDRYNIDDVVDGKVVKIVTYGAFVEIQKGLTGLLHISQISKEHIAKTEDKLSLGQDIRVKIMSIDEENKKISLNLKDVE